MSGNTPLVAALQFAAAGYPVFPLQAGSKAPDGRLALHGFQDATTDDAVIRRWFSTVPDSGIGIRTGDNLVVVDVDPRHNGDTSLAQLERDHGELRTMTVRTGGGGLHLYFRSDQHIGCIPSLREGVDIKGAGGYVVAAGSVHPNGRRYELVEDLPAAPEPLPEWLGSLIQNHRSNGNGKNGKHAPPVNEIIPSGKRNSTLASLAGTMRRRGASESAILAALLEENAAKCQPPLDDEEVERIAGSVSRYPPDDAASDNLPEPEHGDGRRPLVLERLLEGAPPAPPEMAIDDFLLAADVNVLGGAGDAGKSTSMFCVAVATVLDRPLFGSLMVRRPGPVVLVVPEDGKAVARHHVDAIIAGLNPPITDDERATIERDLLILGDERRINLLTDTPALAELLTDVRPSIVILEPISELIGGEDENTEAVAQGVCANLRRDICRPLGAAALLAGHLRKPGREGNGDAGSTVHDLKGSAGWANHARLVWLVSKPKGGDLITFRLVKSNRLQTGTEHQIKLAIDADPENKAHWLSCRLTDANMGAASQSYTPGIGRVINDNERRALSAINDQQEPGLRLSHSAWLAQSGINEETFRNVRERLLRAGLVAAIQTGRARNGGTQYAYAITAGGRNAIATGWSHAEKV